MPITFSDADRSVALSERRKLKSFIEHVLCKTEGWGIANISFVFCSDDFLLDINSRFLNHDDYTDIITFDLRSTMDKFIESEIYISVDRVRDNAGLLGVPFSAELLRVLFHGVLHLCGYKDKTKRDTTLMRRMEDNYLRLYSSFLP